MLCACGFSCAHEHGFQCYYIYGRWPRRSFTLCAFPLSALKFYVAFSISGALVYGVYKWVVG